MGRALDLVGQRFGRLLVLERVGASGGKYVLWRCRCDCGNLVEISTRDLRSRGTVSCGCNRREKAAQNLGGDPHQKLGQVEGTNLSRIKSEKIQKNNQSGYTGVSWHKNKNGGGQWLAVIYAQGKRHYLGLYDTKEEAYAAYEKAKEQLHKPLIDRKTKPNSGD